MILTGLLVLGFLSHLRYLRNDCPIDLSGDEAHYWEWSRQPDIGYYSKGPLVAWIIRGSTAAFGNEMWAVRLPALVFAAASSVLTYWLTARLFRNERLALGAVLLNHLVPLFVAGSLLMTIDPPYFICWGLATGFLALATLEEKPWAWIGVGVAIGIGSLAKYGMLLWPLGMLIFLWIDGPSRKWLRTPWPYIAVAIGLVFLTPPLVWNVRHDWVTFRHVGRQTGVTTSGLSLTNPLELIAGQIGVLGPPIAILMVAAVWNWRSPIADWQLAANDGDDRPDTTRRARNLLLTTSIPLLVICLFASLRTKVQPNWPAAAYFGLIILTAHFIATRLGSRATWRRWRGWFWGAVVFGVSMMPIAHNMEILYPATARLHVEPRKFDPTVKLKGWRQLGERVSRELAQLGASGGGNQNAFVLCEDYMQTAEMAFYVRGQPITYCLGPYITDGDDPKRRTQYDVWPERSLAQPSLWGRDAIYVGYMHQDLLKAFDRVERLADEEVWRRALKVRRFQVWRCSNFKGLTLPQGGESF
jgi:undecaprenyl-diphosphatase